jgi:hypothetical protein
MAAPRAASPSDHRAALQSVLESFGVNIADALQLVAYLEK